jgi:hypothetical protein
MPENALLPISPSVLCWSNQTASNQGSWVCVMTWDPSFRQKLGDNARSMFWCIFMQKIPRQACWNSGPTLWTRVTNLFIKFAVCSLFIQHNLLMDNEVSIKKCSHFVEPIFVFSHSESFFEHFLLFNLICSRQTFFTIRAFRHFRHFRHFSSYFPPFIRKCS